QQHPGALLLAGGAVLAGFLVLQLLGLAAGSALGAEGSSQYGYDPATRDFGRGPAGGALLDASLGVTLLFLAADIAVALVIQTALAHAALEITAGRGVTAREALVPRDLPQVALAAVLLAV